MVKAEGEFQTSTAAGIDPYLLRYLRSVDDHFSFDGKSK